MTVIAILAAAVLPSTIDLIQVQRSVNEGSKLPQVAEALKRGMLREQVFPIYENRNVVPTEDDDRLWWNLASRHGGGSANEVRYPLGVPPESVNTRKLYFAQPSWGGMNFVQVTGNGKRDSWLDGPIDPKNPKELRIILLSTSNIDLTLPDTINPSEFEALWNEWSVGSDGKPAKGDWIDYGLSEANWNGRAPELNIQRIDLRDWFSTVLIENRRAVKDPPGTSFAFSGNWLEGSLYANVGYIDSNGQIVENLVDGEIIIRTVPVSLSGSSSIKEVEGKNIILSRRGKIIDDSKPVNIFVTGDEVIENDEGEITFNNRTIEFELTLTDRSKNLDISGWSNGDDYIQDRYFLFGDFLNLFVPWTDESNEDTTSDDSIVGVFVIDKDFSTLRFDGLNWEY